MKNLSEIRPQLFRVCEVAKILGLSQSTVRNLIASASLPAVRIGRAVRVQGAALQNWMQKLDTEEV